MYCPQVSDDGEALTDNYVPESALVPLYLGLNSMDSLDPHSGICSCATAMICMYIKLHRDYLTFFRHYWQLGLTVTCAGS